MASVIGLSQPTKFNMFLVQKESVVIPTLLVLHQTWNSQQHNVFKYTIKTTKFICVKLFKEWISF